MSDHIISVNKLPINTAYTILQLYGNIFRMRKAFYMVDHRK